MQRLTRLLVSFVVPAFVLTGIAASPVLAQEKGKAVQKVLAEDDRVRVTETTYQPGDVGANVVRGFRVTRALKGGSALRTYADGKTETIEWKTGEVRVAGPDKQAYFVKNVGKSEMVLYTVTIKQPK